MMSNAQRIVSKSTGRVSWKIEVFVQGKRKGARFRTKAEAEKWRIETEAKLLAGTYKDMSKAKKTTLGDVLEQFKAEESGERRTRRSSKAECYRIDNFLKSSLAPIPLLSLTRADVKTWKEVRLRSVSLQTVNREIDILRSAVEFARDPDCMNISLEENVFSKSRRRRRNNSESQKIKRTRVFQDDERARLIASLAMCRSPLKRLAFDFAIETGLRKAELVAVMWSDWLRPEPVLMVQRVEDLRDETTHERQFVADTKNGKSAPIPLSPRAIEILETLRKSKTNEMVFGDMSYNALTCAWKRVRQRAGVVDFHWHDLRHVAITQVASELSNPFDVRCASRHSSVEQMGDYVHMDVLDIAARRAEAHEKRQGGKKE
jgi:integrase